MIEIKHFTTNKTIDFKNTNVTEMIHHRKQTGACHSGLLFWRRDPSTAGLTGHLVSLTRGALILQKVSQHHPAPCPLAFVSRVQAVVSTRTTLLQSVSLRDPLWEGKVNSAAVLKASMFFKNINSYSNDWVSHPLYSSSLQSKEESRVDSVICV